jgi:dihydrofolate reductase
MTKVVYSMSTSLDGFIDADNVRPEAGLGDGGERLHEWVFGGDPVNRKLLEDAVAVSGAVICGRRMYDLAQPYWGADGPTGPARVPTVILTHNPPASYPDDSVYTFATSVEGALEQAKALAGDKMVGIGGGADIGQQYIKAGLVDEIVIHLVPVLFGSGSSGRVFDNIVGDEHVQFEVADVVPTPTATHITYRLLK